jgi:hypothetical protein
MSVNRIVFHDEGILVQQRFFDGKIYVTACSAGKPASCELSPVRKHRAVRGVERLFSPNDFCA